MKTNDERIKELELKVHLSVWFFIQTAFYMVILLTSFYMLILFVIALIQVLDK
jgi:hypothetical protein